MIISSEFNKNRSLQAMKYIIVHHTAVSYETNPDQFNAVNEFHRQKWNMKSSLGFYGGYNYIISANGTVRQYRADGEETVAAVGHNFDSIHISVEGNFDIEMPTNEQKDGLRILLKWKMTRYNIPIENIVPHRQFSTTSCYGKKLSDTWAQDLLRELPNKISLMQQLIQKLKSVVALLKLRIKS